MDEAENKRKLQQERLERLRYEQMNRQDKLDSSKTSFCGRCGRNIPTLTGRRPKR